MKKLSYIILGFIIGAVLTYYFCSRDIDVKSMSTKFEIPDGVIERDKAEELNNNWTEYREAAVDSAAQRQGRKKDNRWTSWKLKDIENYLAYSKEEAEKLGYDMNGIRVYLGVYGENAGLNKKNLTTMFIVPTGKKSHDTASMMPFTFQSNTDLPMPPLNNGHGGSGGYPN
ncbi:hypothetical protein [Flavivirga spongiicola]|uniref:Uncharacterized protein n=1 Tax=Flavivirga spongiicola TaxID=421621 RepID=A0ABU7XYK9_9FLAO|nr:hypothetical protein [Flavivirga sp. MEBiC05379]MDO5980873.1 hypothetical protein [Flavivirga sp. MEBiC05379]